jgi:hypothetical protein
MPWETKGLCVHKKGDPKPLKCHKTKEEADAHIKALYASENKEASSEETEDKDWKDRWVPSGIYSFKDLDAARNTMAKAEETQSLLTTFSYLIDNVIYSSDVPNKKQALVSLVDEFSNRIDGVETKELGGILTKEQLDSAAAGETDPKAKRELRQGYEALGVSNKEIPNEVKGLDDEVLTWKEENGSCKVAFIFSNNYRDDDGFPEIIEEKAHKAYVDLVNSDVLPKPEMWHWHVEGTRWGQIDYMFYHDGFSVALGTVDPGHESEAQALAVKEGETGVSHGMIKRFMVRDVKDPSHIQFYVSKEISDLPIGKAANKFTGLTVFEGDVDMEIKELTPEKREYLKTNFGYTDERLDTIANNLTTKKEQAEAQGRESKEKTEGDKVEEVTPPVVEPTLESSGLSVKAITQTIYKEIADGLGEVMKPLVDANSALAIQVKELTAEVNRMKAGQAQKTLNETPSLSFKELSMASVYGPSAQISGNSSLAKDKPEETKDKAATSVTGIATIDAALEAMAKYQGVQQ